MLEKLRILRDKLIMLENNSYYVKSNDEFTKSNIEEGIYFEMKPTILDRFKKNNVIYCNEAKVKYTATPLFPNKEIMEDALSKVAKQKRK